MSSQIGAPPPRAAWQRRAIIIAVLVVTGAVSGWITFNLTLDALLGGRFFS
ncbi:MAG: hypothetical protein Q4G43_07100 [Mobilicoccus sp.]|nr:hypothetical protein [Mobilicoccus sp.]